MSLVEPLAPRCTRSSEGASLVGVEGNVTCHTLKPNLARMSRLF